MRILIPFRDVTPGDDFSQVETEFQELEKLCAAGTSCLEIGSHYGGSAQRLAKAMPPGSKFVSIDLGLNAVYLLEKLLAIQDRDITYIHGNSYAGAVVKQAERLGPYDLVFIDGGHHYEEVKSDWLNYGPMGKIVAFHDIVSCSGVATLWGEIKPHYRHAEHVHGGSAGLGILWR